MFEREYERTKERKKEGDGGRGEAFRKTCREGRSVVTSFLFDVISGHSYKCRMIVIYTSKVML